MKSFLLLIFLLSMVCLPGGSNAGNPKRQDEDRLAKIQKHIFDTTPEGLEILKKVQKMKPEVNERLSSKNLEDSVFEYSQKPGNDKIYPIGWSASLKISGHWKINFYFQDFQEQYLTAEWEYNKETEQLYPFEFRNAPMFWDKSKRRTRN
jgi:hypothetical protein